MPFQFNFYSSLLMLPFVQGLVYSILILNKRTAVNRTADLLLSCILILMSLKIAYWMLGFAGWYDTHNAFTSFMFYFPFSVIILVGPLLYFYFLSITNVGFKFQHKHYIHLLLPLSWLLLIVGKFIADFFFNYPFLHTAVYQYGTKGPWAELDKTMWFNIVAYASFFYYLTIILKAYKKYKVYALQNFSQLDSIDFIWLRNLIYAIAGGAFIMLLFQLLNWITPLSYKADWYSYLFLGLMVYYVSIKGYKVQMLPKPELHFLPKTTDDVSESVGKLSEAKLEEWKLKLNSILETERPYLLPDLTLAQLAKLCGTNNSILSRVINDGFQMNFNDLINSYRINEATDRLALNQQVNLTLLGIAFDSGFNSKATFNRAFKKQTGKTPKEYIASIQKTKRPEAVSPLVNQIGIKL